MSKPLIFISYSHRDEDWKDRILLHLGVAQKEERFDLWDDRRIEGGSAIKYENGVQWIDELLAEKEKSEDDE